MTDADIMAVCFALHHILRFDPDFAEGKRMSFPEIEEPVDIGHWGEEGTMKKRLYQHEEATTSILCQVFEVLYSGFSPERPMPPRMAYGIRCLQCHEPCVLTAA